MIKQQEKLNALINFFEGSAYRMINVGEKAPTKRSALASGKIYLSEEVLTRIQEKTLQKGDVLPLAEIAGINGAKSTATLLPLCHPLPIDHVAIKNIINKAERYVEVYCYVGTFAKTGVEMEAIAGVQAALLCIYDLCKMYGHGMTISDIRLLYKTGGKSQMISFPDHLPETLKILAVADPQTLIGVKAAVFTISDRAAAGIYKDESGEALQAYLTKQGVDIIKYMIIPDEKIDIIYQLKDVVKKQQPAIVFLSGGTGLGPRDITPEAIKEIIHYEIPGLSELLHHEGAKQTPFAWLSRCIVGVYNRTLIISLPGSPKAVKEGLNSLIGLLPHALHMIEGENHD